MALHQVPAYASIRQKRAFQVDVRTWLQASQAGATKGLRYHINAKPVLTPPDYRQAGSINGDTVLSLDPLQHLGGLYHQPRRLALQNSADLLDNPREHVLSSLLSNHVF